MKSIRRLLVCGGIVVASGCLYHARERTDQTVEALVRHVYDAPPPEMASPAMPPPAPAVTKSEESHRKELAPLDVQTTSYMQATETPPATGQKLQLRMPPDLPGAEAPPIALPENEQAREAAIQRLFPPLPPLAQEPVPLVPPSGHPYSLSELHELAAANSPELRQAASDVESARGALIQARTYPNPTVGWTMQPSNDGTVAGAQGPFVDQVVKTGGKVKLASAAAEMDLRNAELSLRRARNDLATRVRTAYYNFLVTRETMRITRGIASFTEQIYRLQVGTLTLTTAPYEPMALRAQAYSARLAHKQAIESHLYAWKELVAAIGMRQLPLSQVEGRIDAFIPFYDFDTVLDHVLRNHTDVQIARFGLDKARYNLKLAQVTPVPDVEVNIAFLNDFVAPPKQFVHTAQIGFPLPIFDKNKGNIISAESALVRATEEPHRVELNLTTALSNAYTTYKNNLEALDYYRHHILPDQVRVYRGVLARRNVDPNVAFYDLFGAQQTLAGSLTTYLNILGSLWTSAVNVADLLQTDDLFQLAERREIPPLPDLEHLPPWPCCHPGVMIPQASSPPVMPVLPSPLVPQSAARDGSSAPASQDAPQVEHADLQKVEPEPKNATGSAP